MKGFCIPCRQESSAGNRIMTILPGSEEISPKRGVLLAVGLVGMPVALLFISLCFGRLQIAPPEVFKILLSRVCDIGITWNDIQESIVMDIRLPRVLLAMLIGASLAISGAAFQGVFRNPLVGPSILGVAAGAGFGAALGIIICEGVLFTHFMAFVFGLIAVGLALFITRMGARKSLLMLVLSGLIVGAVFTALVSLIKYVADPEDKLPTIVYWLMGSLAGASYKALFIGAPVMTAGMVVLLLFRWRINVLALGDEVAKSLGENTTMLRFVIIMACTVVTSSAVSLAGLVGWVGILVPHIVRMLLGPDHKLLMPASVSIGACYLLLIDDIARSATSAEIPLSILTAIIGAPFFAYLLRHTGGRWA